MPEVARLRFTLFVVAASAAAIDAVPCGGDWHPLRIADDEAWVLGPASAAPPPEIVAALGEVEAGACICDVTDGWDALLLRGPGRHGVLRSLTPVDLDTEAGSRTLVQCDLAGVAGKVVTIAEASAVFWPATASSYIAAALAEAGVELQRAPELDWTANGGPGLDAALGARMAG